MDLNDYQDKAQEFAKYADVDALNYTALALAEEAGEYTGKIAKWVRKGRKDKFPYEDCGKELGDVLWQVAACARALGYTLEQIAYMNLNKLSDREARGVIVGEGDNR